MTPAVHWREPAWALSLHLGAESLMLTQVKCSAAVLIAAAAPSEPLLCTFLAGQLPVIDRVTEAQPRPDSTCGLVELLLLLLLMLTLLLLLSLFKGGMQPH